MLARLAKGLALASTGLLAGAFAYGTATVLPTFYAVPTEVHLAFRQQFLNSNTPLMPAVMVLGLLATIWLAITVHDAVRARACAAGASVLVVVCMLVTKFGNVPINNQIRSWAPASPPVDYLQALHRWDLFHDIRTAAVIGSFLLVLLAVDQAGLSAARHGRADDRLGMSQPLVGGGAGRSA